MRKRAPRELNDESMIDEWVADYFHSSERKITWWGYSDHGCIWRKVLQLSDFKGHLAIPLVQGTTRCIIALRNHHCSSGALNQQRFLHAPNDASNLLNFTLVTTFPLQNYVYLYAYVYVCLAWDQQDSASNFAWVMDMFLHNYALCTYTTYFLYLCLYPSLHYCMNARSCLSVRMYVCLYVCAISIILLFHKILFLLSFK